MFSLEVWQNSVVHHVQPGQMVSAYVKKTEFLIFTSLLTGCSCWWCCTVASPCTCCGAVRKVQLMWVIKGICFSQKNPPLHGIQLTFFSPPQSLFIALFLWMCFSLGPSYSGQCFNTKHRQTPTSWPQWLCLYPTKLMGTLLTFLQDCVSYPSCKDNGWLTMVCLGGLKKILYKHLKLFWHICLSPLRDQPSTKIVLEWLRNILAL